MIFKQFSTTDKKKYTKKRRLWINVYVGTGHENDAAI